MKLPKSSGGDMIVHLIDSPQGQAELASHGLITYDLITAIKHFQVAEGIRVGTLIGINEQGFFGAKREGWLPDQPDAFSEPLISIPWVQVLEYLERNMSLQVFDGMDFEVNLPASPINDEECQEAKTAVVERTLEPAVVSDMRVVLMGKVLLARNG